MKELETSFKEYIEEVKKLSTEDKREELLNSIKEIIVAYTALSKQDGINLNPLKSKEKKKRKTPLSEMQEEDINKKVSFGNF